MAEPDELDVGSNLSGSELLWRSLKTDLAVNRANQTEQLQLLKGAMLRQPGRQKHRKKMKIHHLFKKKYLKKKAFQKTLKIFKALKHRLKRKKKVSAVKDDCISTMEFMVLQNVNEKLVENEPVAVSSNASEPHIRHQSVQTDNEVLQNISNKYSTDSFPPISPAIVPLASISAHSCTASAGAPPMFVLPPTWGPWIQPVHALGTCCSSSKPPASLCTEQLPTPESHLTKSALSEAHLVNQPSATQGYSLKDICEQLLLQFASKEISKETVSGGRESMPKTSDLPIFPTAEMSLNTVTDGEAHSNIELETDNGLTKVSKLAESRSHPLSPSRQSPSSILLTPDLLRVSQCHCVFDHTMKKDDKRQGTLDLQSKHDTADEGLSVKSSSSVSGLVASGPEKRFKILATSSSAMKVNAASISAIKTRSIYDKSPAKSVSQPANSLENVSRVLFESGTSGEKDKTSELSINGKSSGNEINFLSHRMDDRSHGEKLIFERPGDISCTDVNNSSEIEVPNAAATVMEAPKINSIVCISAPSNEAAEVVNAEIVASTQGQSQISCISKDQHVESNAIEKGSESPKTPDSKVLTRVQKIDMATNPMNKRIKSPAFEDIDPAEMENVLLVLRQQEQLHQNPVDPAASASSNFIFKKMKKSPELPPELRHEKIFPSLPLKRQSPDNSSALEILEEQVKKPNLEDDDDIPETSPQPVIPPPKRRRLRLNPSPLTVVIQRNKVTEELKEAPATSAAKPAADSMQESAELTKAPIDNKDSVSKKSTQAVRASKRLKNKESDDLEKETLGKGTSSSGKVCEVSKLTKTKKTVHELIDELNGGSKTKDLDKQPMPNIPEHDDTKSKTSKLKRSNSPINASKSDDQNPSLNDRSEPKQTESSGSPDFTNQIKERADKLKRQWLLKTSNTNETSDTSKVDFKVPLPVRPTSPIRSHTTDCSQDNILSENKIKKLRDVPIVEIGRAHDTVAQALLNPWRGLVARHVTRGFVCPPIESKEISRYLWDLRSNAGPKEVTERILALSWKDCHPHAIRSLVSLFVLALSRQVPFVFEADVEEDDDTCSLSSDAEFTGTGKKRTPIRLVASKQIFKGECIEGLNGLLINIPMNVKEEFKAWSCPKFKQSRNWALFGPLAYLKRKETNSNTKALIVQGELIAVKATRHILVGEKLSGSFIALEKQLFK